MGVHIKIRMDPIQYAITDPPTATNIKPTGAFTTGPCEGSNNTGLN